MSKTHQELLKFNSEKSNNSIKKRAEDLSRQTGRRGRTDGTQHVKRSSPPQVIRGREPKTALKSTFTKKKKKKRAIRD